MKKIWDNLKISKQMLYFLLIITIIALISGSVFSIILDKTDQSLLKESLNTYILNIKQNNIDVFKSFFHLILSESINVLFIWLLGISIIGLPIIILLYFSNTFILGFSIGGLIVNYKFKGLLFSILSTFPHQLIYIGIYTILVAYALDLSLKLLNSIVYRKVLDFKKIINKYIVIGVFSLLAITLTISYETLILPNIIKLLFSVFKI